MKDLAPGHRGDLHARLREVEKGLYRAEYTGEFNPENPDEREWPDYHVATTPEAAKTWVENLARSMNYGRVVWDSLPD